MTVRTVDSSRQSPSRTGEVELLEFPAKKRACEDRDREIACSDLTAFGRGNQECAADGDADVDSGHLVVGEVKPANVSRQLRKFRIGLIFAGIKATLTGYQL